MCQNCGCRKNPFDYNKKFKSENLIFNATDYDIEPSDSQKAGQYVEVKVVGAKYHYKTPTKTVFKDGELKTVPNEGGFLNSGWDSADKIRNWAIIKPFLDKGYGLKFLSLLPADENTGNGNGNGNGSALDFGSALAQ